MQAYTVPPELLPKEGDNCDCSTVRVTNLSEDSTECDVYKLFYPYGDIEKIFLAKDKETGRSKGFAFIRYSTNEEAECAVRCLNCYDHDFRILFVELAIRKQV